jgi:hypothetical protein
MLTAALIFYVVTCAVGAVVLWAICVVGDTDDD